MENETTATTAPNTEMDDIIVRLRGNPERLWSWDIVARVLNEAGFRTPRKREFTSWSARQLAERRNLAIDHTSKGQYFRGQGATRRRNKLIQTLIGKRASVPQVDTPLPQPAERVPQSAKTAETAPNGTLNALNAILALDSIDEQSKLRVARALLSGDV